MLSIDKEGADSIDLPKPRRMRRWRIWEISFFTLASGKRSLVSPELYLEASGRCLASAEPCKASPSRCLASDERFLASPELYLEDSGRCLASDEPCLASPKQGLVSDERSPVSRMASLHSSTRCRET